MTTSKKSESWGINLATMLSQLSPDQYQNTGANIGTVVKTSPLTISIYGGSILIRSDIHKIYIKEDYNRASYSINFSGEATSTCSHSNGSGSMSRLTIEDQNVLLGKELKKGDKVLIIADNNDKTYFIVDKFIKVGG